MTVSQFWLKFDWSLFLCRIDNKSPMSQVMACHLFGDKPIFWTHNDPGPWNFMASLDHNELTSKETDFVTWLFIFVTRGCLKPLREKVHTFFKTSRDTLVFLKTSSSQRLVNSLMHTCHLTWSSLVQVPSYYLNQCWLVTLTTWGQHSLNLL